MLWLSICLAGSLSAAAEEPSAVAFVYLRPTQDAAFKGTQLSRLAEAQRLRKTAESVLEAVSGRAVLGHEALRETLGNGYLVDLFDCAGAARCLARQLQPLIERGVRSVVVAEYAVDVETYRVRARRLELPDGQQTEQTVFQLSRIEIEAIDGWRKPLSALFNDTGAVRLILNVASPTCTLDKRPCQLDASGLLSGVSRGQHLLTLQKAGYRDASRVVEVVERQETRVVMAMEALPLRIQAAPDPTAKVPVFSVSQEPVIRPFGAVSLNVALSDQNNADVIANVAGPRAGPSTEWNLAAVGYPLVLGVQAQHPRLPSGWQVRGAALLGFVYGPNVTLLLGYAEIFREGFTLMLGMGRSPLNSLNPGTLQAPAAFGSMMTDHLGVLATQTFGSLVLELGVGKLKSSVALPGLTQGTTPLPTVVGRVALVSQSVFGKLYNQPFPLTVSASGQFTPVREGLDERAAALAQAGGFPTPELEDLKGWLASVELYIPFGKRFSFAGEAYSGTAANQYIAAVVQGPRLDLATGRHHLLLSAGGWAQLSMALVPSIDVRVLYGEDRILSGLDAGINPRAPTDQGIRRNQLAAANVTWYFIPQLSFGLQVQRVLTSYRDPTFGNVQMWSLVGLSQLVF